MKRCSNCRWHTATRKGLCLTCYMYKRRNGVDRPWGLIVRAGQRAFAKGEGLSTR